MKTMKVYSITTEEIGNDRRIIGESKFSFSPDKRQVLLDYQNPFHFFDKKICEHMDIGRMNSQVIGFLVTIKTTKGRFVQGYTRDALKGLK